MSASAPAVASAAPDASLAVAPPTPPPSLTLEQAFSDQLAGLAAVHQLDGELLIVDGSRVLRAHEGQLEWVADAKRDSPLGGEAFIFWIGGRYPDAIDVIGQFANDRAPIPYAGPLTGKASGKTFPEPGRHGYVAGIGYRDGAAIAVVKEASERRFVTLRGAAIPLVQTSRVQAGCPAVADRASSSPAIDAIVMGSSRDGTLIVVGEHCGGLHAGVEVWPRQGEAKVLELRAWESSAAFAARVLPGRDRAWLVGPPEVPILELKDLTVRALPPLGKSRSAFVGPDDALYASDGRTLRRWVGEDEAGAWQPVATLAWPTQLSTLTLHRGVFWGSVDGAVFKLVPSPPLELTDACKTPFVHLLDVPSSTEPGHSFPSVRKALSSVEHKKELSLLEFTEGGRRLGVRVPDRATGEAVIAAVRASLPERAPRLICYEPGKVLRRHAL